MLRSAEMDNVTETIPVKSEECIIDLEASQESEDTIERWHEQISKRINVSTQRDNEKLVDDMMLAYNSLLKDKIVRNKDKPLLKTKALLHIRHFYLYYKTLGDAVVDTNYFTRMEDILTYYCNLEMELVYTLSKQRENKKYNLFVIKRLCKVLGIYLHHRLRHIIHVLLKMKYNMRNPTCQMVMRRVYCHFLMTMPSESLSDEVFCRYYLIFERYKQIAKPDEKQMLEEFVFKKFGKTKNFLRRNPIMMTVLSPCCDSVPDALTRLLDYRASAIQAYFIYLKNQVEEAAKSVADFDAGCGSSEFLSTFNEIPVQTENLTIDSDSDIEELEEDSTIVLSEGEEMEITYKIKNPKKTGTKKIDVIDLISDEDSQPIPDKISSPSSSSGISSSLVAASIGSFENMTTSTSVSAVSTPAPSISPIASEMNDEALSRSIEVPLLLDKTTIKENVPATIFTTVKQELLNISGSENLFQKVSLEETPSLASSISAESRKLVSEFSKENGKPTMESAANEDFTAKQINEFISEEANNTYIASSLVSKQLSLAIKTPALFNTMSTGQSTSYSCKDNKKQFNAEDITPLVQTSLLSSLKRLKLNEDSSDYDLKTKDTSNSAGLTDPKIILCPEILSSNSTQIGTIADVCEKGNMDSTDIPPADLSQINDNTNSVITSATTEEGKHEEKCDNEQTAVPSSIELATATIPILRLASPSVSMVNQKNVVERNNFDSNVENSVSEETTPPTSSSTAVSTCFSSSAAENVQPIQQALTVQESANEKLLPESNSNLTHALSSIQFTHSENEVSMTSNTSEPKSSVLSNYSSTSLQDPTTDMTTQLEDTISADSNMSTHTPTLMNIDSKKIVSVNSSVNNVNENLLDNKNTEATHKDMMPSINTCCTISNEIVMDTTTPNSVSKYKGSLFTEVVSTISVKPISSITHNTTTTATNNTKPKIESFFIHQISEEVVNTVKLPKIKSPERSNSLHKNGLLNTEADLSPRNYKSNHTAKYISECVICRLNCCKQDGSCKRQQTKVNSDSVYKFGIATPPAESRYDEHLTDLEDSNLSTEDNLIYPRIIRQSEESDVSDDRIAEGMIYNESAQDDAVSTSELDIKETIVQILPPTANTLATPNTLAALGFETQDKSEKNYKPNVDNVESNKSPIETEYRAKYNGINITIQKKESSDHRRHKKSKRSSKNKKKKSEREYSNEKHSKPQKVLFTSKAIKWDNYSKIDSDNELDGVLSGPVSDINNQFYENSDVNFNLFGYANSIPPVLLASAEKSKEIESPAFTGMDSDDFRNFIQNEFPFNGVFKFNDRFNSYSRTTNSDNEPVSSKCGVTFNDVVDTRFIEPSYSESEEEIEKYTVVVRDGIKCFLDAKMKDDKKLKAIPKLIINKISDNDLLNKYKVVNHNTLKTCIRKKIDCTLGANCTAVMTNDTLAKGTVECKGCIYIEVLSEDMIVPATNNEICIIPQDTFPDSNIEFSNSPKFLPNSEELQQCVDKTLDSDNLPTINMLHEVTLLSDNSNCYDLKLPTEFSINQNIQTHSVAVNSSTPLFTNISSNLEQEKNILSAEFTIDQVTETKCTPDASNNLLFINVTSNLEQEKNDIDVVGLDEGLDVILFKTDGGEEKIDGKNEHAILATINPVQCNYANPNDYVNNGFLADFAIKTKSGLSPTVNVSETDTFNYLPDDLYSYFLIEKDSTKAESLNQDQPVISIEHLPEPKPEQPPPILVSEPKLNSDGISFAPEHYMSSPLIPPVNYNTHSSVQLLNECNKLHERKTDEKNITNKVSQKRSSDWLDTTKPTDSETKIVDTNSEFSEKVTIDNPLLIPHNVGLLTEEDMRRFYTPIDMKDLIATLQIGGQTKLPFKKRRVSVNVKNEVKYDPNKEEISYPATPMISIAEVEELQHKVNGSRPFKTPAERSSSYGDLHEQIRSTYMQGHRTVVNGHNPTSRRRGRPRKRYMEEEDVSRKRRK